MSDGARQQTADATRVAFTIGHSTRPIADFAAMLTAHRITTLIDVRTVPRSRHNPQYDSESLAEALAHVGIAYDHAAGLGGFRRTSAGSPNTGWRNTSFRGYADYMQTAEFAENLFWLMKVAEHERSALMCAEAVPWRCHRSLIADALVVHGWQVDEIVGPARLQPHRLTPFASVAGRTLTYPPVEEQ